MQTPTPPPELVVVPVPAPAPVPEIQPSDDGVVVTAPTSPGDHGAEATPATPATPAKTTTTSANSSGLPQTPKTEDELDGQETTAAGTVRTDTIVVAQPMNGQDNGTSDDGKEEAPAAPPQLIQSMWRCHRCECTTFSPREEALKSPGRNTTSAAPPRRSRNYARARRGQRYHPYPRPPEAAASTSFPMGLWSAGDSSTSANSSYPPLVPMLRYRIHRSHGTNVLAIALRINVETDPPVYDVRHVPRVPAGAATPSFIMVDPEPLSRLVVRAAERIVARRGGVVAPVVSMYVEPAFAYLVYSCAGTLWDKLLRYLFARWTAWNVANNRRQWGLS